MSLVLFNSKNLYSTGTLRLSRRADDPDHLLHTMLHSSPQQPSRRLKSSRSFSPGSRQLMKFGDHVSSVTHSDKPVVEQGMGYFHQQTHDFTATIWCHGFKIRRTIFGRSLLAKLNRLQTRVGRFHTSMCGWVWLPFDRQLEANFRSRHPGVY